LGSWYAVDISGLTDPDLALAAVDEFEPAAAEDRDGIFRIFFPSRLIRDRALDLLRRHHYSAISIDVDDEDWARRSQANLTPVTVGCITVIPSPQSPAPSSQPLVITIQPSMGFGTGHHATTRLCLAALQSIDLSGRTVLDVGTGSGVLAIAAVRLGAASAIGIDIDDDAIQSAGENLAVNPAVQTVSFLAADFRTAPLGVSDVVVANLTGALLARSADRLRELARADGTLVVSGVLTEEREEVVRALAPCRLQWAREEDGWVGLVFDNKKRQ
jgi:ribosomal protein L11 methyltransferase